MANVTNIMVVTAVADKAHVDALNDLERFFGTVGLVSCLDTDSGGKRYGGDCPMEHNIHIGACRGLYIGDLVAAMRATPWNHPELVQVFVCTGDDEWFRELDWARGDVPNRYD